MMRESVVSSPCVEASTTRTPSVSTLPATTSSPTERSTGSGSPSQGGFVDGGASFFDVSVDRDAVAGPNAEQITRCDQGGADSTAIRPVV